MSGYADIDTLAETLDDALLVFEDTQWARAYRNVAPAALSRVRELAEAAEAFLSDMDTYGKWDPARLRAALRAVREGTGDEA